MFTDADRHEFYEVYGDATFVHRHDRFDDALARPHGGLPNPLETAAFTPDCLPLSEMPALELPLGEPTAADLHAIENGAGEDHVADRIANANARSAYLATRRELLRLREQLAVQPGLGRAA